jgi:branched-chain amino acid transport system substrate-binding protein
MKQAKMNTLVTLTMVFLAVLALSFSACTDEKEKGKGPETIKIGAILPLTGDAALYGNNDRQGIDLAVEIANANGGVNGRKIEVVYEDNKGEAKTAVSAINKLDNSDIQVVIDDAISTVTLAMLPVATQKKILVLSTGATNPSLSGASPYFFRIWNSDAEEGVFAAEAYFNQLKLNRMAILYVNNDYGKGLKDVFEKKYTSLGGEIVAVESFDGDTKDFRNILFKLKGRDLQAIYLIGYASETGIIVKQLKELKIDAGITGTVAMEDAAFLNLAGKAAEGVIYVFPKPPKGNVVQEFRNQFKEKYGTAPAILCDVGYDAANLVIYAYRNGAKTSDDIRRIFAEIKEFKGASGEITFDNNGDVHKPMILKTVREGDFVEYR